MEPSIALAVGAEDNAIATWAASLIEDNLRRYPKSRKDFFAMRAAVAMVAPDRRLSATLRFDLGQLTVHDGMIGVPDVTLCADYDVLVGVVGLPLSRLLRLPLPGPSILTSRGAAWRETARELLSGELKIYGLLAHPILVTRLLRMLCRPR